MPKHPGGCRSTTIPTYTLIFEDDDFGPARRMEFDAISSFATLNVLQNEPKGRKAILHEDDKRLAELTRLGDDFWAIQ